MNDRILVFTLHRSASMFLHKICAHLSSLTGRPHYSPNNRQRPLETSPDKWIVPRACYGPLRGYAGVPGAEDCKIILHLRDPRDVLVSMFFSYCYSHPGEVRGNTGPRKQAAVQGIDEFVLNMTGPRPAFRLYGTGDSDRQGNLLDRYGQYAQCLFGKPHVTWVKYEEMVTNFRGWLEKFSAPFKLEQPGQTLDRLERQYQKEFTVAGEDIWRTKRQVTPGDHKRKLKEETLLGLNLRLRNILTRFGYAEDIDL